MQTQQGSDNLLLDPFTLSGVDNVFGRLADPSDMFWDPNFGVSDETASEFAFVNQAAAAGLLTEEPRQALGKACQIDPQQPQGRLRERSKEQNRQHQRRFKAKQKVIFSHLPSNNSAC